MLNITDNGTISILSQTADGLDSVNQKAESTNNSFGDLVKGSTDLYYGMLSVVGVVQGAIKALLDLMATGEQMQRGKLGLDAISGGNSKADLDAMTATTKGLVSQLDLVKDAYQGIATGIARTPDDLARIAQIGAILGEMSPQIGNAQQGVVAFEAALEHVGQTRPLAALGLDIQAVKDEYTQLVKEGMDKGAAWTKTLLDQGQALKDKVSPAINDSTTAVDRMTVAFADFKNELGGEVASTVMEAMHTLSMLGDIADGVRKRLATGMTDVTSGGPGVDVQAKKDAAKAQAMADPSSYYYQHPYRMGETDAQGDRNSNYGYVGGYDGGWDGPNGTSYNGSGQRIDLIQPQQLQWGPVAGMNAVGASDDYKALQTAQALDAERQFNALLGQDADYFFGQKSALGQITAEFQAQYNLVANRHKVLTEDQAFGLENAKQDKLYSDPLTEMTADFNTRSKRGIKITPEDLQAVRDYEVATGLATKESLAFDDAHKALSESFVSGKIDTKQYTDALENLANGAKDGTLNLQNLQGAIAAAEHPLTSTEVNEYNVHNKGANKLNQELFSDPNGKGGSDPFAPLKKSADDAGTSINALPNTTTTTMAALMAQGKTAAGFADPVITSAKGANAQLAEMMQHLNNLAGFRGVITISGSVTGLSGGGHGSSLGPTAYAG